MILHARITGVVLAGGRARRMGGLNKALIPLGAAPTGTSLSRILDVFEGRFDRTIVVAASPGDEEEWRQAALHLGRSVTVTSDRLEGCGPLAGVHAALRRLSTPLSFVCGCDMPSLSGALLDFMAGRARDGRLLVPVVRGRPEPLHALYPASYATDAERALRDGIRMMLDFLERVPVDYLAQDEFESIDGAMHSFTNINTPEDLEALR